MLAAVTLTAVERIRGADPRRNQTCVVQPTPSRADRAQRKADGGTRSLVLKSHIKSKNIALQY